MIFRRLVLLLCLSAAILPVWAQSTLPAVLKPLTTFVASPGAGAVSFDLRTYFGLPGVSMTGSFVQWDTSLGKFNMELFNSTNKLTVTNFLSYVTTGAYNQTIFDYRDPSYQMLAGGLYTYSLTPVLIAQNAAIANEPYWSNTRGTIGMSQNDAANPNSATSGFYFNLKDNTYLDAAGGTGFTVFGRVLGSGMTVVDALGAVPTWNTGTDANGVQKLNLPLQNFALGSGATLIQLNNYLVLNSIRSLPLYPSTANADTILALSVTANSNPAVATVTISGSALVVTPVAASGTTFVTIRVADTDGNYADGIVPVSIIAPSAPSIINQPANMTMPAGSTAVISVNATGYPLPSYQWHKNGVDIVGATDANLLLRNISATDAANYSVTIINLQGFVVSTAATLTVASTSADPGRLVNLSVNTNSGTGAQVLNVGFVIGGAGNSGNIPVLVRGIGPGLIPYGVPAGQVLNDPALVLNRQSDGTIVAANDNWGGDPQIVATAAAVGAFALPNTNSKDAALVTSLPGGVYAVLASGVANTTGQVLAEIYAANSTYTATTPRLVNISARAQVGTGGGVLIAGFVISGSTPRTVLIRGVGPTLAGYGVTGCLPDPQLSLYQAKNGTSTLVATNDNWGGGSSLSTAATQVGAFTLTSAYESVLLLTLPPGVYTAQVSGVNGATGIALVEVYEVY